MFLLIVFCLILLFQFFVSLLTFRFLLSYFSDRRKGREEAPDEH